MNEKNDRKEINTEIKRWFESDIAFNSLYPEHIKSVAEKHWTPLAVAEKAANFLVTSPEVKTLDIGSGSGKFCLTAAYHNPKNSFYGVEQRPELVALCNELSEKLGLNNISFICDNIMHIDFKDFDSFYFYNSFYENIEGTQKIDYTVEYSEKLYDLYNRYLYKQLDKKPAGTRLVTYHSFGIEVPPGYEVVHTDYYEYLKFWVKI